MASRSERAVLVRLRAQVQEVLRRSRRGRVAVRTARPRVVLQEVRPAVVRVIDVPARITHDLHDVLQVAVGWTDSHLHQFRTDTATYAIADEEWDDDGLDERGVRLADLPARFVYAHDFGDGGEHDGEVIGSGGEVSGCVNGEGALPA